MVISKFILGSNIHKSLMENAKKEQYKAADVRSDVAIVNKSREVVGRMNKNWNIDVPLNSIAFYAGAPSSFEIGSGGEW